MQFSPRRPLLNDSFALIIRQLLNNLQAQSIWACFHFTIHAMTVCPANKKLQGNMHPAFEISLSRVLKDFANLPLLLKGLLRVINRPSLALTKCSRVINMLVLPLQC